MWERFVRVNVNKAGTTESLQLLPVGLLTAALTAAQVSLCICLDLWPFVDWVGTKLSYVKLAPTLLLHVPAPSEKWCGSMWTNLPPAMAAPFPQELTGAWLWLWLLLLSLIICLLSCSLSLRCDFTVSWPSPVIWPLTLGARSRTPSVIVSELRLEQSAVWLLVIFLPLYVVPLFESGGPVHEQWSLQLRSIVE